MPDPAAHFRDMADRIDKNDPKEFAGALLIVPPDGAEPLEILLVQQTHNLGLFLATALSIITVANREFEERARGNDPFQRR